jgi:hypothetical protein
MFPRHSLDASPISLQPAPSVPAVPPSDVLAVPPALASPLPRSVDSAPPHSPAHRTARTRSPMGTLPDQRTMPDRTGDDGSMRIATSAASPELRVPALGLVEVVAG